MQQSVSVVVRAVEVLPQVVEQLGQELRDVGFVREGGVVQGGDAGLVLADNVVSANKEVKVKGRSESIGMF